MCSTSRWNIGLLAIASAGAARADDEWAEALDDAPVQVTGIAPPRLTRTDVTVEAPRSLPGYRSQLTELSYRWWASSGRADLGLGLGTVAYVALPVASLPGGLVDGASATVLGSGTVLTLGMRYRTSARSTLYADAAGIRGLRADGGDAVVGKVGVEFKAAQSSWNIGYGGLGVHLAGDTRMTLRLRKGGLAIAMRSSF